MAKFASSPGIELTIRPTPPAPGLSGIEMLSSRPGLRFENNVVLRNDLHTSHKRSMFFLVTT